MKFKVLVIAFLTIGWVNAEEDVIPEDLKPIQQTIFERLVTPEDSQLQRDIKSLFSQYILVAAMNAVNTSDNAALSSPAPVSLAVAPPRQPVIAAAAVPQPPQVIYVYVTQPTTPAPVRTDNSKVKTKKPKPTKPPKTKKPKPPKAPHPDFPHTQTQAQPQVPAQPSLIQQQQEQLFLQQQYLHQQQQQYLQQQKQQEQYLQQQQQQYLQQQQQQEPQSDVEVAATSPPLGVASPTTVPILAPAQTSAPAPALPVNPVGVVTLPQLSTTLRPRPSNEHVLNQVDKILDNVGRLNITGIVDQSLQINSSKPVQNLVTGILNTIFCTPINRLLGRCRG